MGSIPKLEIRTQDARIGIQTTPGSWNMRQPKGELEITTDLGKVEIRQPTGILEIDQSQAWDALGVGSHRELLNNIYSEARQIALQGIARIVENGNRMYHIEWGGNPIADIAAEQAFEPLGGNILGEPSYDNVDIHYTAREPEFEVTKAEAHIRYTPRKPQIEYTPGNVTIRMLQYPSVEIIPPKIDLKL